MPQLFGMSLPEPEGEPIYENLNCAVRKTGQGWFIVYKDGYVTHYRQDRTDALRLACDMSFESWAKEYETK